MIIVIMNHEIALYWKTHIGHVCPHTDFDEFFLSLGRNDDYNTHIHLITKETHNIYVFKVNGKHPKKGLVPNDKKKAIKWALFFKKQLRAYIRHDHNKHSTLKVKTRRHRRLHNNKTRRHKRRHSVTS